LHMLDERSSYKSIGFVRRAYDELFAKDLYLPPTMKLMQECWKILPRGIIPKDRRIEEVKRLDQFLELRNYSKGEWLRRAEELRRHVRFACGLLPEPKREGLNAEVFGRREHGDYSVEKVLFESHPDFYVTGNLYRPLERGRHPGVLNPHGHWSNGRLAEDVRARCINFAKQGCVAFLYDMIGYNDSQQIDHKFGGPQESLWGLSLMGLQTWNSIRAIDFLQSLGDVDPERIGCTGESGGGTQTYMVSALDERIKASAPVCMVSAHFQGGCLCENAPGLRLDTNNVEIASLMAPRPLLLVSATGDWSRRTPWAEYPFIRRIYGFLGAADKVKSFQVNAPHNYNRESREAVYEWFGRWLLGASDPERFKERPYGLDKEQDILVFAGRERPAGALNAQGLVAHIVSSSRDSLEGLKPTDRRGLERSRGVMAGMMKDCLAVEPSPQVEARILGRAQIKPRTRLTRLILGRRGRGEEIPGILMQPTRGARRGVLMVHQDGKSGLFDGQGPNRLVSGLLSGGCDVLSIDCFLKGEFMAPIGSRREITACELEHYDTYNRTDSAYRAQDILTALSYLRSTCREIGVVGLDDAGAWCLLASSVVGDIEPVCVDLNRFPDSSEEGWLKRFYVPGIMKAGGLRAAAALHAPRGLMIHNVGNGFDKEWTESFYEVLGVVKKFRAYSQKLGDEAVLDWMIKGA
jgi:dienelactone hydrolase